MRAKAVAAITTVIIVALLLGGCSLHQPSTLPGTEITESNKIEPENRSNEADAGKLVVQDAHVFTSSEGGTSESSYGIVLKNESATNDAIDIDLSINYLDKTGTIVGSEWDGIHVVPAGEVYYVGGSASPNEPATKVEVDVKVGRWAPASAKLAEVSNLKVKSEGMIGTRITGLVTNTTDNTISRYNDVYIVLFDSAGKMVGGGFTYLPFDLKPGKKAAFNAGNGVNIAPAEKVKRIGVSVDGDFGD